MLNLRISGENCLLFNWHSSMEAPVITFFVIPKFETKVLETICVELTISKKKWCILFAYWLPQNNSLKAFFEEINLSLSAIVNEYENIMLIGNLNLNTKSNLNSYYSDLCDTFDLTNLIKASTCFKSSNQTSFDVILTNRPRSFQQSAIITTELSDYHKMTLTFFRSYFSRLPPKTITSRMFRYFETKEFLYELENYAVKGVMEGLNMMT